MSDKAQRRSAAEQYELIIECRSSGMSDHQWCVLNNPGFVSLLSGDSHPEYSATRSMTETMLYTVGTEELGSVSVAVM